LCGLVKKEHNRPEYPFSASWYFYAAPLPHRHRAAADDRERDGWRLNEELHVAGTNVEGKPTAARLHLNR